ncbi:hypothetical protein [Chenggangzhangella methanolivorans]|uniref:LysM domain-containing protein n=1 Tax=Chenggangzhangella methanolivorans TaxID=1437009 RepID=A0A9E6R5V8_9HYPH|nr:hypothetical protein [Chenggangzhangella methanolivorans]QZN98453.1 hypothetical protein K6K41_15410 [Chenggangzhangella methanolivorans]
MMRGGPADLVPAAPDIRPTEVPRAVAPGDTLTGISRTANAPVGGTIANNAQIQNPDLIRPPEVVLVPTSDPATINTRTQVATAEAADRRAAVFDRTPTARMLSEDRAAVTEARTNARDAWTTVETGVAGEIRQAGETARFPVDETTRPTVEAIRARVPESPTFQERVTSANQTVDREWRETRATGAQLQELTDAARQRDADLASLKRSAIDPALTPQEQRIARDDAVAARALSDEAWGGVRDAAQRELTLSGGAEPFADRTAAPTLDAIRATNPNDPRFQQAVTEAADGSEAAWRADTTTSTELSALATQASDADQELTALQTEITNPDPSAPTRSPIATLSALNAAEQNADGARQNLETELTSGLLDLGEGEAYPEETTVERYDLLTQELPENPTVERAVADAREGAVETWRAQGVTRDTLGVVVSEYEQARDAQAALDAARASADPADAARIPELEAAAARELGEADAEAERQIQGAHDAVEPEMAVTAGVTRAATMQTLGLQDETFQAGVDEGLTAVVIDPRVEAVRDAYGAGGPNAAVDAAAELERATSPDLGVPPEIARRVVDGSLPTIQSMGRDLGDRISWTQGGPGGDNQSIQSSPARREVFSNIALATDRASLAVTGGPQTTRSVAQAMVDGARGGAFANGGDYRELAALAMEDGAGAGLQVAMAGVLHERGDADGATNVVEGVAEGFERLRETATERLDEFRQVADPLVTVRQDFNDLMTPEQADAATERYLQEHPEFVAGFDAAYEALAEAGADIQRAAFTANDPALAPLAGIEGVRDLRDARNGAVNDPGVASVVNESPEARSEAVHRTLVAEARAIADPNAIVNPGSSSTPRAASPRRRFSRSWERRSRIRRGSSANTAPAASRQSRR